MKVLSSKKFYPLLFAYFISISCFSQVYHNPVGKEYPIVAWYSVEPDHIATKEYYKLKSAGFNLALSLYFDKNEVIHALKEAEETGVKLIVDCKEIRNADVDFINTIKREKALGMYFLDDEPSCELYGSLSDKRKKIYDSDSQHNSYINLYPIYASKEQLKSESYSEYVRSYIEILSPPFVSFDHYPFVKGKCRDDYFDNLKIVSSLCNEYGVPFWGFVRTLVDKRYDAVEEGKLRFQVFSNIAYGAKGIQYYTYTTLKSAIKSILDKDYAPTDIYSCVSSINKEVQSCSKFYNKSFDHTVYHVNDDSGICSDSIPYIDSIKYDGCGYLLSFFKKGSRCYLLIVNKDYDNSQALSISFKKKAITINEMGEKRGRKREYQLTIGAGDGVLFQVR